MKRLILGVALGVGFACATQSPRTVRAHTGRGFEIEVVGGKLQAQGVNNGDPDGLPAVRPYVNSIHDHWGTYIPSLDQSSTTFPEFEVTPQVAFSFLEGYSLELELLDSWQWMSPALMPPSGTVPQLVPLDSREIISMQTLAGPITTNSLGSIQLSTAVPGGGTGDVVPSYTIDGAPSGKIHVLQFTLSATAPTDSLPDYSPSDPLYVIISPAGADATERLHHASLYLEQFLAEHGVQIPEPASAVLVVSAILCFGRRRTR